MPILASLFSQSSSVVPFPFFLLVSGSLISSLFHFPVPARLCVCVCLFLSYICVSFRYTGNIDGLCVEMTVFNTNESLYICLVLRAMVVDHTCWLQHMALNPETGETRRQQQHSAITSSSTFKMCS